MTAKKIGYSDSLKKFTEEFNNSVEDIAKIDTDKLDKDAFEDFEDTVETFKQGVNSQKIKTEEDINKINEQLVETATQLDDTAISARRFNLIGDGTDETTKLSNVFNSSHKTILFPKNKTYNVSDTITVSSGVNKKIDFNGSTILVDFNTSKDFMSFESNVEIHNATFDFNHKFLQKGLIFKVNLGTITLKNVVFKNVYDKSKLSTIIVQVSGQGNTFNFENVTLENMKKLGDGTETVLFEGILTTGEAIGGGTLKNTEIKNFQRVNSSGEAINDISNAIYLASSETKLESNVLIDGLKGYNFGKRLLKSQVSNLTINNVYAESYDNTTMTALSLQDRDSVRTSNVRVNNVTLKGNMGIGIVVSADNVKLSNININIDIAPIYSSSLCAGISIAGDDLCIDNASILARYCLYGNRTKTLGRGSVRNVTLTNSKLKPRL